MVESIVAPMSGVTATLLAHPRRNRPAVVFARHLSMYLLYHPCGLSLTRIGRFYGRDRRNVAYAIATIERRREDDAAFDQTIDLAVSLTRIASDRRKHAHPVDA